MTEEEITEQMWLLIFGAVDRLPEDRRQPWLLELGQTLTLIGDPDNEISRLIEAGVLRNDRPT